MKGTQLNILGLRCCSSKLESNLFIHRLKPTAFIMCTGKLSSFIWANIVYVSQSLIQKQNIQTNKTKSVKSKNPYQKGLLNLKSAVTLGLLICCSLCLGHKPTLGGIHTRLCSGRKKVLARPLEVEILQEIIHFIKL